MMNHDNFISECFVDTLVVKTILKQQPKHQEGITNVLKTMKEDFFQNDLLIFERLRF